MSKFTDALKAGVRAAREESAAQRQRPRGDRFSIADRVVRCAHCGGEHFDMRSANLHSTFESLANLEWLAPTATALICTACTGIQLFGDTPDMLEVLDK